MDQHETPLFTALRRHAAKNPLPFHIPGHKRGRGMAPEFREFIGDNALSIDLINIAPLDDLHRPVGVIREAQRLAAEAFGADHTFFSVQGTSGAIMTMILTVCAPGEKIIVPRNVHKSIMSAIIFAGARPIFVSPVMDRELGIAHGVTPQSVERALERHPDAKAVVVINPTYYGVSTDLKAIVELAHGRGIPVLVDEAHGVHIHFHEKLPLSAMQAGADMAATSVHKLGGSLTQSSVLNVRAGLVSPERVQSIISMLTTTSTSYLLLASLDCARKQLALRGRDMAERVIALSGIARARINRIPGLYCFGEEMLGKEAVFQLDPGKLTIHVSKLGITGYDAENWLREHANIEVELSDMYNLLCVLSPGDSEETVDALVQALERMSAAFLDKNHIREVDVKLPDIPTLSLSPRDAFYAETETVPLAEAAGRIIAEFIFVYPPGIPILLPGEVISEESIAYIMEHLNVGLPIQGPEDKTLTRVKVIVEEKAIF